MPAPSVGDQLYLFRRATVTRAEVTRILDVLVPLRQDADPDDMEASRRLVGETVKGLLDELGAVAGPHVQVVDRHFADLTGAPDSVPGIAPSTVEGQLGSLRERFGLTDSNVNTIEDETARTNFWILVDLVRDLQASWSIRRHRFEPVDGSGDGVSADLRP